MWKWFLKIFNLVGSSPSKHWCFNKVHVTLPKDICACSPYPCKSAHLLKMITIWLLVGSASYCLLFAPLPSPRLQLHHYRCTITTHRLKPKEILWMIVQLMKILIILSSIVSSSSWRNVVGCHYGDQICLVVYSHWRSYGWLRLLVKWKRSTIKLNLNVLKTETTKNIWSMKTIIR